MTKHLKTMGVLAVAGVVAAGIASVSAHHSTTMFDHSTTLTINGEVVELRWVVCHERRHEYQRRATVREMKEGPSGSAIRC